MNAPTRATPAAAQPLVCIVDDDPFVADALIRLLEVVGYHSRRWPDADAFLTGIDPGQAGCLLLDIRLPGRSGLELLAALPDYGIGMPTIVMTGYANVATAVRAMKLGALDLLEKPLTGAVLVERVRTAIELDTERRRWRVHAQLLHERLARLTQREHQVFALVLAGRLNKVIAAEIGVGVSTVEMHRRRMMEKLEVRNVAELVRAYSGLQP